MGNFWRGLLLFIAGFMVWVVASVGLGIQQAATGERNQVALVVVAVSFFVMTLGPLMYWFWIPVRGWIRRRP